MRPLVVAGAIAAAVALHFFTSLTFELERPYVALFLGVLFTAWIAGIESALATALLSAAIGHLWLFEPGPALPPPAVALVMFVLLSMALAAMLNSWRQALRRADTALERVREHERELVAARDAAEAGNRTKSRFLATVSHEIRTPMNAVVGMTDLLLEEPLSVEQREFAETIRSSSEALLEVLNGLLDFSKIEAGHLELEHVPFDLRECVESVLDLLAPGAAAKGLEPLLRFDPELPDVVVGDPTRLRQVLVNLIGNAIKFTERGEVELAVTGSVQAGDDAAAKGASCELHLAVRDTGIGIPADRRDRLFQSFSQVDASTTRRHGGTGLGLAISRALAEAMGGAVWAESEGSPGLGSTFHVALGVELPSARTPRSRELEPSFPGRRVLVVEDNAVQREILDQELLLCGIESVSVASGDEALAHLDACGCWDAALVERDLPGSGGVDLARAIRARSNGAQLPLLGLLAANQVEQASERRVFAAVLKKPVKRSRLHRALAGVFAPGASDEPAPARRLDAGLAARLPLRILLVEDSPANQRVALLMLRRLGYEGDVAANGLEALGALERCRYDLVLMDAEMPGMDGVEATRRIRAEWPRDAQPRIVALTANALPEDHERFLAAGMDACLVKPIRPEELQSALEGCAGRREKPADGGS